MISKEDRRTLIALIKQLVDASSAVAVAEERDELGFEDVSDDGSSLSELQTAKSVAQADLDFFVRNSL